MEWDSTSITYITFEVITGFITIIGNSIVLIAILRTTSLHTVTNVFVGNLAIADIFVGLVVAPLAALSFLGLPRDVYGCIFINSAIVMLTNISILMLLAVAMERFIAISLPYTYKRLLTVRRALVLNACIWTFGTVPGLVPMFGWNIAPDELSSCSFVGVIPMEYMVYFQFFGFIILPILAMFLIYVYIWHVIRKHMKQRDILQRMYSKDRRLRSQWKKDVRAAKFFAVLIALFGLFWLPVNILNCFSLFCPECYKPYKLLLAAIVMSHANSSINPFLYAASNSRIQRAIMSLLRLGNLSPNSPDDTTAAPSTIQPNVGVSTISNNPNDGENTMRAYVIHQPSFMRSDQKECSNTESFSTNKPKRSSLKVGRSNDNLSNQNFETILAQNGKNSNMIGTKNSTFMNSDDLIAATGNRQTNRTDSQSIHSTQYMTNDQATLDSPKQHRRSAGRVNFAFVDDNDDEDSSRVSSLPIHVTNKAQSVFSGKGNDTSHQSHENIEELQQDVKDLIGLPQTAERKKVYKNDTLTTNTHFFEGVTTQQNEQNVREQENLYNTKRLGKRYGHLFQMESESSQEQDLSKIIYVHEKDETTDNDIRESRQQDSADRPNHVIHSYISPQAMNGGIKVTDVETNVLVIGAQLHHTRL